MLEDEADEVQDSENSSDSDERQTRVRQNQNRPRQSHKSSKAKAFAADLLLSASESDDWDDAELAKVAVLIIQVLGLKYRAAWRFLNNSCADAVSPTFLAKLKDEGLRVRPQDVFTILQLARTTTEKLLANISECVAEHVLDLSDEETLSLVVSIGEDSMNNDQRVQYAAMLCEHCDTKKQAGRVLNAFVNILPIDEAASLVHEVVEFDFFLDLKGEMNSFYKQFGEVRRQLEERLTAITQREANGSNADEDEDEHGNLIGFIADDDEIIDETSESDEENYESRVRLRRRRSVPSKTSEPVENLRKRRVIVDDDDDDDDNNTPPPSNLPASLPAAAPTIAVTTTTPAAQKPPNPLAQLSKGIQPISNQQNGRPTKQWIHKEDEDESNNSIDEEDDISAGSHEEEEEEEDPHWNDEHDEHEAEPAAPDNPRLSEDDSDNSSVSNIDNSDSDSDFAV